MKKLFTSEVTAVGGRSGSVSAADSSLKFDLGNPLEAGIEKRGPNPETLFAAAYAACYQGALMNAAKRLNLPCENSTVRALVSLNEDDAGGFRIAVELHAKIPGASPVDTTSIMTAAHQTCPYSKALRGEASVTLVAD